MIKKIFTWIGSSFDTHSSGASARKLTAFAFMLCIVWCHLKWIDHSNVVEALWVDVSGLLLCLGIVTAEQVIRLKNGGDKAPETNQPATDNQ